MDDFRQEAFEPGKVGYPEFFLKKKRGSKNGRLLSRHLTQSAGECGSKNSYIPWLDFEQPSRLILETRLGYYS